MGFHSFGHGELVGFKNQGRVGDHVVADRSLVDLGEGAVWGRRQGQAEAEVKED